MRKFIIGLWAFFGFVFFSVIILLILLVNGFLGHVPDMTELENIDYKFATQVMTSDGKEMGTWSMRQENRVFVDFDSISPNMINALIATEDIRFYEHPGIDLKATLRALVKTGIMGQENAGGGSTITQQLAKLLFTEKVSANVLARVEQKALEHVIAVRIEKQYTKNEIITLYLNKYDFGNNAVGIRSASHVYFGKQPSQLSIEEAAMLVGMCKNSSLYNPRRRPLITMERRNVVLGQMVKAGYITAAQKDSICAPKVVTEEMAQKYSFLKKGDLLTEGFIGKLDEKKRTLCYQEILGIDYHSTDHKAGIAPYFREFLRLYMTAEKPERSNYRGWQSQQFYDDSVNWADDPLYGWCNKNTKPNGEKYNIYTDGLKIYTSIDSRMQKHLEDAVKEHMVDYLQPRFYKTKKGKKTAPYTERLSAKQVQDLLNRSMKQSDRYRIMKNQGYSEEEIVKAFNTPCEMDVFTYDGLKDTVMTPMDSIRHYKFFLRTGVVSMDPVTGEVKAYAGGTNYYYFKYDMAGVGRRQVGSTVKPYLYSLVMESGYAPHDLVRNVEQVIDVGNGRKWRPRNGSRSRYGELVSLKWGLTMSNNWISAFLIDMMGPYSFKNLLKQYGLGSLDIDATPSLCLGTCDASVLEMVSAYTVFVGKGMRTAPLFVTRIEDNAGNVVATFSPRKREVISEKSSYKMIDMMRGVVNDGTGSRLRRVYGIRAAIGGKTGTTQRNSDGWFMGYTPSLVTGCWVGGEDRDIHFDRTADGQGASMALPIWGLYMKKLYADKSLPYTEDEKFDASKGYDTSSKPKVLSDEGDGEYSDEVEFVAGDSFDNFFDEEEEAVKVQSNGVEESAEESVDAGFDEFE